MTEAGKPNRPSEQAAGPAVDKVEHAVDRLDEERREELFTVLVSHEQHSGPVPSPRTMAGYEIVSPGLASRIVAMAERQQRHEHGYEDRALESESFYRLAALVSATVVVAAFVAAAVACAWLGREQAAIALAAVSGLTLMAGAFIKGRELFPASSKHEAASRSHLPSPPRSSPSDDPPSVPEKLSDLS